MARQTRYTPRIELLEDRSVPALFGTPWADGTRLTVSFAPDGTSVDGVASDLFQSLFADGLTANQWRMEIARAVSAWTASTNLNIGIVDDGGEMIGVAGATQGDARFGDIRLVARPLSDNVLAITTPPGYLGGTRVGDVILNSNVTFSVGGSNGTYDLYSVILQELGHALGVGNSTNLDSPMFEQYQGVRQGLIAEDLVAIQNLYGISRAPDDLEGANGNDDFSMAAEIRYTSITDANAQRSLVVRGDISTNADLDYYRFRTPKTDNGRGLTVQVSTGRLSMLAPRLHLYSKTQSLVGMVQTTNPFQEEVAIFLPSGSFALNTDYYIRVDSGAAGNQYTTGAYQLRLVFNPDAGDVAADSPLLLDDAHDNDLVSSATKLSTTPGYKTNAHYRASAVMRDINDKDYYQIRSQKIALSQKQTMTVTARAADPASGLVPLLTIYDKNKTLVSGAVVLVNGNGIYTLQLPDAGDNDIYYIGVEHAPADGVVGTGTYQLDIDFRAEVVVLEQFASGTLTDLNRTDYQTLVLQRDQAMHFLLSAESSQPGESAVRMTIHDYTGEVVFALTAKAGETLSATTLLTSGTYTVRFHGSTRTPGTELSNVSYLLKGATLDDPIGPTLADPTKTFTWKKDPLAYYFALPLKEPTGDIVW
jgi:hypothetical protein